ncbi:MAG TPA: hypothetical protein VG245_06060 [Candidatus Dormibacteraeota bacterium]|jgi:hypothetical protein|nr:hypothetical protein [Candidatus Dormibacteraeota bacterium]
MRLLRATVAEVVGLFVADWTQTIGILAILALGWLLSRALPAAPIGFALAALLAAHLLYTTVSESRRRLR